MIACNLKYVFVGFVLFLIVPVSTVYGQLHVEQNKFYLPVHNTYQENHKSLQYKTDFYPTEDTSILTLSIINFDFGGVLINGIEVSEPESEFNFPKGDTISLIAVPEEGYVFLGWKDVSFNDTLEFIIEDDLSFIAFFGSFCMIPPIIDEEVVLSSDCDAYYSQGPIIINSGGKLIVEEGSHILITQGDSIFVHGELIVNGSVDNPVCIRSLDADSHWGCIRMLEGITELNYTEFYSYKAVVSSNGGELIVRNCTIPQSPFYFGDILSIHHSNTIIENNLIYGPEVFGKTDVIDCDQISSGSILNNTIYGATDDGIDIGTSSSNVVISGNRIFNCNSMGISIGENSVAEVSYNVVVACEAGLQIHSESTAYIDHNTLFDNDVSIRCYHYPDEPNSGGHAIVTNTILSSSNLAIYELFPSSSISFDYSISDTEPIDGTYNLNSDPLFIDPENFDFGLLSESPCKDSGDPLFPVDPDGTRSDIGALYFDQSNAIEKYPQTPKVTCFPNPVVNYVCFELADKSESIQSIEIFDQHGQATMKNENINSSFIRIDNIPTSFGFYFATVLTSQNTLYTCSFIISPVRSK